MKKKRIYRAVDVENFDVRSVLSLLAVGCIIAVDVAKSKFVAAIATAAGEVLRLVRFEHPRQTLAFLRVLVALRDAKLEPRVVMEPTGTYGDAVRHQCHLRKIPVHMMAPKHTHDLAEVLDGVPSMHDPKAATALAQLQVIRPAPRWEPPSEADRDLRAVLDQRSPVVRTQALYFGLLEATLARHWPELHALVDVRVQRSWMALLKHLPGPQAVAASSEEAAKTLRQASRARLSSEAIAAIVSSAKTTLGVPMTREEQEKLRAIADDIERGARRLDAFDARLAQLAGEHPAMGRMAKVVGPACAAAIVGYCGSPEGFSSASALEKAMGLNLRERSSGEKKGRLSITKRGPAEVRQLLFMAALRLIQHDAVVAAWYRARGAHRRGAKMAAITAVMRKLARALWHVARGATFDARKLFDARRLDLPADAPRAANRDVPSATARHEPLDQGGAPQQVA